MRLYLTILFMLISTQASAFKYEKVFFCGKTLDYDWYTAKEWDARQNYYIHFGANDDVVIWNEGYQYATFETKKFEHLWNQNAAVTKLNISQSMDDVIKFEMLDLLNGRKKMFLLDLGDLTYLARVSEGTKKYEPTYGVCKIEFPK